MPVEKITHAEWLKRGTDLFGTDFEKWRFACPGCGNVASIGDFKPFKERGATPHSATCECIGRYTGKDWLKGQKPCNYAGYGLFQLSPVVVIFEDGKESHSFAFADSANGKSPTDKQT